MTLENENGRVPSIISCLSNAIELFDYFTDERYYDVIDALIVYL